jgi:hypothetical protein
LGITLIRILRILLNPYKGFKEYKSVNARYAIMKSITARILSNCLDFRNRITGIRLLTRCKHNTISKTEDEIIFNNNEAEVLFEIPDTTVLVRSETINAVSVR